MQPDVRSILDGVASAANGLDGLWREQEHRHTPGSVRPLTQTAAHGTAGEIRWRRPYLPLVLFGIALASAVVAVTWLLFRSDGTPSVATTIGVPALVSRTQLEQLAASADNPVYWAGPRRGFRYELTMTTPGRIFVRYLPDGVAAGDPRPDFLTVGTYPGAHAFADLKRAAGREGATWVGFDHGGLVVSATKTPRSAYLGYRGERYQVEVYSPASDTARNLVLGGKIVPVS